MTDFEELLSELGDYPQELLDFLNGESTAGWVDFADDEAKKKTCYKRAKKALNALYEGQVDRANHSGNYGQLRRPGVDPRAINRIYELLDNQGR